MKFTIDVTEEEELVDNAIKKNDWTLAKQLAAHNYLHDYYNNYGKYPPQIEEDESAKAYADCVWNPTWWDESLNSDIDKFIDCLGMDVSIFLNNGYTELRYNVKEI